MYKHLDLYFFFPASISQERESWNLIIRALITPSKVSRMQQRDRIDRVYLPPLYQFVRIAFSEKKKKRLRLFLCKRGVDKQQVIVHVWDAVSSFFFFFFFSASPVCACVVPSRGESC